ncbi:MAG: sulfatase [Caldilineaceae bacterium]|nr:sulfatase [Caldilineaceae bacterium]
MKNLILIDCHDLGRYLGCYGRETIPSPNLDAIAEAGVRFDNAFCTSPQCSPSRAALYTGRYPHANGMLGLAHPPFAWGLHPDEEHLAARLQRAGYHTGLIGAQHVAPQDEQSVRQLGFDAVYPCAESAHIPELTEDFLAARPDQPFFLNIGFTDPHRDGQGRYGQAPPDSSLGVDVPAYLPQTQEAAEEFARFQGVVRQMDAAIGRIVASLQASDLLEESWLIFVTDHGIAMPRAKCTLYDAGLEISLIMLSPPLGLTSGRVYNELISNVDVTPAILDMLHIPASDNLQGRSFAPLLRGEAYTPREAVFAEKTFHTAYEPQRAVRSNSHKLIWNGETDIMNVPGDVMRSPIYPQMIDEIIAERPPFELYDLRADPFERVNLFDRPEAQAVRADLIRRLRNWMTETRDPLLDGPIASPYYSDSRQRLFQL